MEARVIWRDGMAFEGRAQEGHSIPMDATPPLGHGYGPNPKEILLSAVAGCAAMDVVGLLRKDKQIAERIEVVAYADSISHAHPIIFEGIDLVFNIDGDVDRRSVLRAIDLSQTIYSGVSAMICETVPIRWFLYLNGERVGQGRANFERFDEVYQSTYEG